mgnify:CR=1 FL=1
MNVDNFKLGLTAVLQITKESPVLLEVKNGRMIFASYNNFHNVIFETETDLEDFKVVFPEKVARQIPKQIKKTLSINQDGNTFSLVSDGSKMNVSTLSEDSMSLNGLVHHYQKDTIWEVDPESFKDAFKRVQHSANDKLIGDVVLKGYHLNISGGKAEVMASNGASMSLSYFDVDKEEDNLFLLNQEFFNAVKLINGGSLNIGFNNKAITLINQTEEYTLRIISSLNNGKPLNYGDVLNNVLKPRTNKESSFGYFNTKEMKEALKKMEFFFDESVKNRIHLEFQQDRIVLSSNNLYGDSKNQVRLFDTNFFDAEEIYVSGVNLLSFLNSTSSENVEVSFVDKETPVLFSDSLGYEVITVFKV